MLDLRDQAAMFDLWVLDHLSDVVDERDAGVDVFKSREPLGGCSGFEDFAERGNYLFLRGVIETLPDEIFAPQHAAGVLPEFMLQRAQAEITTVFRLVDLITGVATRQPLVAALWLGAVGQEAREFEAPGERPSRHAGCPPPDRPIARPTAREARPSARSRPAIRRRSGNSRRARPSSDKARPARSR